MSGAELPAPLVPAWVDLRSYDWFPFYHKRLRQSEFWKSASDLACRISVDLWSEAYEQVPAGSIPNNDHILSEWAGFGRRDLTGWLAAKDEVLSAWTLCSDGRWYHPTLSEVARQAGVERRKHLWSKECDRIRKENVRRQKSGADPLPMPPKPSDDPWTGGAFSGSSAGEPAPDQGRPEENQNVSERRPPESPGNPPENALTRTGTEILDPKDKSLGAPPAPKAAGLADGDPLPTDRQPSPRSPDPDDPVGTMFHLGKRLWGAKAGGSLVGKLRKAVANDGETAALMRDIATDMGPDDGRSYLLGIVKSRERSSALTLHDTGDAW